MGKQMFDVQGRYLGYRIIPNFRRREDCLYGVARVNDSYAYYCIKCGDIWARLVHEDSEYTQLFHRPCERHGDGRLAWYNPGGNPIELSANWPREALLREFMLELRMAEQERTCWL